MPSAHTAQSGGVHPGIFISVDALSAGLLRAVTGNDPAKDSAHFRRCGYEGATTFDARSDSTHTVTLPNRMTLSTVRPMLQPAGHPNTVHHCYAHD